MAWASTAWVEVPASNSAVIALSLALRPDAVTTKPAIASSPGTGSTVSVPPRGMLPLPINTMLSSSFTRFLANNCRGRFQVSVVLPSSIRPRAAFSASPRSICAPAEPAAPNASRQNCSLAEAWCALFLISSSAKVLVSSFLSSSMTSMPLTIAPTGLIKSWHTREHTNAARSRALIAREPETGADVSADDVEVEDVGVEEDVGGTEGADIGKLRSATLEPAPCHSTADSAIGQRLSVITLCYKTRPRLAATGHHKGAPWQVPTPVLSSWTALPPSESRPHKPSWLARRITKSASKPTARR